MSASVVLPSRPTATEPRPWHFPRFERRVLANGLRLIVAPVRKLPIATVALLVEGGATADPEGQDGIAQLTARLMLEGTSQRDGAALTEAFERLGATVEAHADWDLATVSLTALTERLPAAMSLLGEVLRDPAFPAREVERLKSERISDLLQLRSEPRGLADETFAQVLYDARSRFARPDGGREADVEALTREQVQAFYQARYRPAGATCVIVGDLTVDAAAEMAQAALGAWSGEAPIAVQTLVAPARTTRAVHLVSRPDAAQSELRLGHVGVERAHPDYFPILVMNAVLGGLFSSRINLNLREAHGYTYGASSYFDWRRQPGPFVVSTAVQSDVTAAAAREALLEIDRMRSATIEQEELTLATSYLDGVFPIRYETTHAIAAALSALVAFGLPEDYFDRYRERVRGVTVDDVLEAARRHLQPEAMQMLVVGNVSGIRESMEALAFGEVVG
ncbi:MAG: peptidase domain protein [Gemmatimonadetes bacterium]|nr:peptidase domain protein [Gemmatimonadota bacterium]